MHNILRNVTLSSALVTALCLGGCATEDEVKHAQSTADQALSLAQQAQQTAGAAQQAAQAAQQSADSAHADINALSQRVDSMQVKPKRKGERG
jgi:PBP1b-binding outer membrane lipoprotein LpoB